MMPCYLTTGQLAILPDSKRLSRSVGKPHVIFILSTTLTTGAGTEQFVLNVVKNAPPDKFDISIVQTDLQDRRRLNPQYVDDILRSTTVYTIKSFRRNLGALDNASNYLTLAIKQFSIVLLGLIYRRVNASTLDKVRGSDLVYLIRNDDLPYLKIYRTSVVLGSTHCSTLTLSSKRGGFGRLRRLFRVLKYRRIDGFHFTSAKWQRESVLHKKCDFLLPLGTDTDLFYPQKKMDDRKGRVRFLFVSRLEADKGVTRLLDAWKLTSLANAELHIAGTGSLAGLVKMAADNDRVVYHGVLSNEDLAALYRSCDIFVFPTRGEIYGLVVLEALASGLFAIVSEDLRGNFDEFENMGVLEYVRNDLLAISEGMVRIASSLNQVPRREKAYDYIKANNDWRSVSTSLFSTFNRILLETD